MVGRRRSTGATVAGVTALALLAPLGVTASAGAATPATQVVPAPPAAAVDLVWGDCASESELPPEQGGGAVDCAVADVPLDHDVPDGPTIGVALKRRHADDPDRRIGSLFVNPGGPGDSGVDVVDVVEFLYAPEVLARFDVIGFDPRGVARSAPLTCSGPEEHGDSEPLPLTFPVTARQEHRTSRAYAAYTARCAEVRDPLLEHMSTADVARDLDLLRAAVGDQGLTYAGYSYGSLLGTTYANLFPSRVRALVLDGVVDPVAWTTGVPRPRWSSPTEVARRSALPVLTRLRSAEGAYATLREFFRLCQEAGPQECALAQGGPERRFHRVARRVLVRPVDVATGPDPVRIGYAEFVDLALSATYHPGAWPDFAAFVAEVERSTARGRVGPAYDRLTTRLAVAEAAEAGAVQTVEGRDGVTCSDSDNPRRARSWRWAALEADLRAPYFGRAWTWASIACATWPAPAVQDRYAGPWNARTVKPVLVIGNRYDPATPYSGAQTVAGLLPSSRLLTLDGWGHAAVGLSGCIDQHVSAYVVDGELPPRGATCEPDLVPFAPLDEVSAARSDDAVEGGRQAAREQVVRRPWSSFG